MMRTLPSRCLRLILLGLLAATLASCGIQPGGDGNDSPRAGIDNAFESDDPATEDSVSGTVFQSLAADASAELAVSAANQFAGADASRAVEEADIIRVDDTRLYALSRHGGLSIIDISNPDKLTLVGRKRVDAQPFEMYVRNGRAYLMLNDYGHWVAAGDGWGGQWVQSSQMLALDVADPASIKELSTFDVPGNIADSRMVGDALYLVTYQDGYCWRCTQSPSTVVTSFLTTGGQFAQVQQLAFSSPNAGYSSWQRSVAATNERLYIAGPEWNWTATQRTANSVIQVVDITDPAGKMTQGADVPVAGQINNRWQMDEYQGVLRVVSQFGSFWWGGGANPKVQTFRVASAREITPLGQTELILPRPESLRSVRFDGDRAYAVTAQQTDPLYTIDLRDPAQPKQMGELEMPGWIFHMEPRGDRLVGFGFSGTNWGASLQVSLFDVSDLTKPTMLKRVEFGSGWGNFAEDQDRIHKAIRVLDDKQTILVPFASYGFNQDGGCGKPVSGIQLIDYTRDALALRGVAPQRGMPRRAVLAGGRLLGVSDRNVSSFDISTRDAPTLTSELDLSNPANRLTRIGDQIATISNDRWTGEAVFSLTPGADPDNAAVSGRLSLRALSPDADMCKYGHRAWADWYAARIFAVGNNAVVTVPFTRYESSTRKASLLIGVIDASDPKAPRLIGQTELPLTSRDTLGDLAGARPLFVDGRDLYVYTRSSFGALVSSGDGIVQIGSKIAFLEADVDYEQITATTDTGHGASAAPSRTAPSEATGNGELITAHPGIVIGEPYYSTVRYKPRVHRKLHVIDVSNGTAPRVAAPIDLGDSPAAAPLHRFGSTVLSSRWVRSATDGKVKFYVDRVDLAGDDPRLLASINVPGSLLAVDEASNRLVTTDYTRVADSASNYFTCAAKGELFVSFDSASGQCVSLRRTLKLLDLDDTTVTLRQTWEPPAQNMGGVLVSNNRIYVTREATYDWSSYRYDVTNSRPALLQEGGLWAIGGIREGTLGIVSELKGDAKWPLAADGSRVALYTPGGVAILDTLTPTPTVLVKQDLRGWGYASHVLFETDRAVASLGDYGMQAMPLQ